MAFWTRLSTQKRRALYIGIGAVILFLLYYSIYKPAMTKRESIQNEIKLKEADLEEDYKYINQKKEIKKEYDKYKRFIKIELSPKADPATELAKQIEALARKSQLSLTGSLKPETPRGVTNKYLVKLEYEGRVSELATFLYEVSNHGHLLLRIEQMELSLKGPPKPESKFLKGSAQISQTVIP